MLKLYLYGYLQQVRSSRGLENECRRNVELMWLLNRLTPDHESIAEFRRMHSEAVTQVGEELIGFARSLGLVCREWVAVDGSRFRAVGSVRARGSEALPRLETLESADQEEELVGVEGVWVGATRGDSSLYFAVAPGEHQLCASWQSAVILGAGHQGAVAHFRAEDGGVYYFRVKNSWSREYPGRYRVRAPGQR